MELQEHDYVAPSDKTMELQERQSPLFHKDKKNPPWICAENLNTFPNLKVVNSSGSFMSTNAALIGVACPQYACSLQEITDVDEDPVCILPEVPNDSIHCLDELIHTGITVLHEGDAKSKSFIDSLEHFITSKILEQMKVEFLPMMKLEFEETEPEDYKVDEKYEIKNLPEKKKNVSDNCRVTMKRKRKIMEDDPDFDPSTENVSDEEESCSKKTKLSVTNKVVKKVRKKNLNEIERKEKRTSKASRCLCGCKTLGLCDFAKKVGMKYEHGYDCYVCGFHVPTAIALQKHVHVHHKEVMFQCTQCDVRILATKCATVIHHMEDHTRDPNEMEVFQCIACGDDFETKKPRRLILPHKVDISEVSTRLPIELTKHYKRFGPGHNEYCTYTECSDVKFNTFRDREMHINQVHGGIIQYRCGHCLKVFSNKLVLKVHVVKEHQRPKSRNIEKSGLDIACQICGKVFDETRLKRHERHCGTKSTKKYPCEVCGKHFRGPMRRDVHVINIHVPMEQRPCKCDICGKGFASQVYLKKHKKIHLNLREYKCSVCGQGFNDYSNAVQHEKRVHKVYRPNSNFRLELNGVGEGGRQSP